MRSVLLVAVGLTAACKGEPFRPDAAPMSDASGDAGVQWFSPMPNAITDWDIQLSAPYDLLTKRDMMILDLWSVIPANTTLTYADGSTLMVPAGAQPSAVASLKARDVTVICHVGTGAIRLTDPDASKFPGHQPSPPDRPNAPASGSVIGWSTPAGANERFVDFRNSTAAALLQARIKLAKEIDCDGVLAHRNDAALFIEQDSAHGFSTITEMDQTKWITDLAAAAHMAKLSIGGIGTFALDQVKDDYDWIVVERCGEHKECSNVRPFIEAKRAVFGIDYQLQEDGTTPNTIGAMCMEWPKGKVDGVLKDAALTMAREACPTL